MTFATTDPSALSNMRDIGLPAPISAWPPAIGWQIVLSILALSLLTLAIVGLVRLWKNRYRRAALREIKQLDTTTQAGEIELAEILKRVALVAYGRRKTADLFGDAWLKFLDSTAPEPRFSAGPIAQLCESIYAKKEFDTPAAAEEIRRWIRTHRAPKRGAQ